MASHEEEEIIRRKVNELRHRLTKAVLSMNSLSDEHIVAISQELDSYIVQLQKNNLATQRLETERLVKKILGTNS
ncbi:aspartyl-phosphate phosphatase Spo0E family protein [Paenibacillus alvei]|uniref:aspartyl-phosphate phosphatase Spo0E family protein n=1 Tax=Paenibacillus alvei TaxID=44250 RepID=UPI0013DC817A|nr:aspartyl-phosphate phosphatase Spo0E family protein [Paenibacillus alvei]MBG9737319.1 hypothetical protein [Paenibacillus alvei]MBG9746138.1 hypothetical protein [Paenibacillus alvei]MCY9579154.1 aspartyl-phosphate phosphatase Spo0E family protein [Paenibacillus alvei]MCY9583581.1 aspartyl-phosphate phosphatase Spo0E family protein [Paenibacillus alvei]NEZ41005.1 Spo0E family sporulation regulatory protein-aspartic acid phosphatase [Paenibacillus alvei]